MISSGQSVETLAHLKQVSRIKHLILNGYVPSWARIVGRAQTSLYLVDCFAGPGQYEFEDRVVDGSPLIGVKAGSDYAASHPSCRVGVLLVDDNKNHLASLREGVRRTEPHPRNLTVAIREANSHGYIPGAVSALKDRIAPAFILVDPYGHPLSLPTMRNLLRRPRTELLINLMWYRVNMDLANPSVANHVTELVGDEQWKGEVFMRLRGRKRERAFLEYFAGRLGAKYIFPFRIKFDREDKIYGSRTKYYLLHASNHVRAVLLMKEVMWPLGDEEGTFEFAGSRQQRLISQAPDIEQLRATLLERFRGRELTFDEIRSETWSLPFIGKHYRSILQEMRAQGAVIVTPVTSKATGLQEKDRIRFVQ